MTVTRSASGLCLPAWGTPRNPDRASWGPTVGRIAAKLGKPFMPWQQHVADVSLEIDPEDGGLWYRGVDIAVPRQSGKTTFLLPRFVWRAEAAHLLGGRQRMLYTAQTGKDAVEKFDEDYVEDLAAARVMRGRYRVTNHQGRKRIRFQSGSILSPVAPTGTVGHGKTLDDGALDEAWAQKDNRVEDGWRPAMITRRNAQLLRTSTAGESQEKSPYWFAAVHRGRAIVEAGDPSSRLAYFEWCAAPDADPQDPATWWSCMPALGFTQTEAAIRHEFENIAGGLPAFRRAFLNQWTEDEAEVPRDWVFPRAQWAECCDPDSRRVGPPVLAVDVEPDRKWAAVAFAGLRADGRPMAQVVRHALGTSWVAEHVGEICRAKRPIVVVIDGVGPAKSLRDDLERAIGGASVLQVLTVDDVSAAYEQAIDAVATAQLVHTGQAEVTDALEVACERVLPGGRKALDRRTSDGDITSLIAVVNAAYALRKYGQTQFAF